MSLYIFPDTGYHLSLMMSNEHEVNINKISSLITQESPGSKLKSKNGKILTFVLPLEGRKITSILNRLELERTQTGIQNVSLTLTTLEDVFLK